MLDFLYVLLNSTIAVLPISVTLFNFNTLLRLVPPIHNRLPYDLFRRKWLSYMFPLSNLSTIPIFFYPLHYSIYIEKKSLCSCYTAGQGDPLHPRRLCCNDQSNGSESVMASVGKRSFSLYLGTNKLTCFLPNSSR